MTAIETVEESRRIGQKLIELGELDFKKPKNPKKHFEPAIPTREKMTVEQEMVDDILRRERILQYNRTKLHVLNEVMCQEWNVLINAEFPFNRLDSGMLMDQYEREYDRFDDKINKQQEKLMDYGNFTINYMKMQIKTLQKNIEMIQDALNAAALPQPQFPAPDQKWYYESLINSKY